MIGITRRGAILHTVIIHIILIVVVFGVFFIAMESKAGTRAVKQQIIEKQLALLIDSADEGMSFEARKRNIKGFIDEVEVRDGRIYVSVDGFRSSKGYPYFSKHLVSVERDEVKFIVRVG